MKLLVLMSMEDCELALISVSVSFAERMLRRLSWIKWEIDAESDFCAEEYFDQIAEYYKASALKGQIDPTTKKSLRELLEVDGSVWVPDEFSLAEEDKVDPSSRRIIVDFDGAVWHAEFDDDRYSSSVTLSSEIIREALQVAASKKSGSRAQDHKTA